MTPRQTRQVREELDYLQAVNLHPALLDTGIGGALVAVDELIFTALRLEPLLKASDSVYRGIEVVSLRQALDTDLNHLRLSYSIPGFKSILTAMQPEAVVTPSTLRLSFQLRYEVFRLNDDAPKPLEEVKKWFSAHDQALQAASPELKDLAAFAATVAIFRTASERRIPHDLDRLVTVTESTNTPRFICRSSVMDDCKLANIRMLLE
jgi:hypothetical protein